VDRQRIHDILVIRVNAVNVIRERRETVDVLPHLRIRGVEQVRTVLVDLDAGRRLGLAVRVATDMRSTLDDRDLAASISGALCNGETEEARPSYEKIHEIHRIGASCCARTTRNSVLFETSYRASSARRER